MIRPAYPDGVSLRISVTDRCQFRCVYCVPAQGVPSCDPARQLGVEEILRFVRLVKRKFGLRKVHLTGGEPLIRSEIVDLVAMLAREDIEDLALTTNGRRLSMMARDLRRAGLQRINVSLDSLDPRTFARLARNASLGEVLQGIDAARSEGFAPIKLNTVVLRGYNDAEVPDLAAWAIDRGCPIRFLELMPIGCIKPAFERLIVPASEVRSRLEKALTLDPMPYVPGESSRNFLAQDRRGRRGMIGFITPHTEPFCKGCTRLRLTSDGRLVACLARGTGLSVKELLRSRGCLSQRSLVRIVSKELRGKSVRGGFETKHPMAAIGG